MNDLIATTDDAVNAHACGAMTWWELSGYAGYSALRRAWEDAGMPEEHAPNSTSPAAALARTLRSIVGHELLRPLGSAGAWAIVNERREGDKATAKLDYSVQAKVWLGEADDFGERRLEWDFTGSSWSYETRDAIRLAVTFEYEDQLDLVSHQEVSGWLIQLAKYELKGLGLRDRGGLYYIPKEQLDTWRAVAAILERHTGHRIKRIPALTSKDALEAVTDALLSEADDVIKEAQKLLAEPEPGKRALRTRKANLAQLVDKMGAYDSMLGERLTGIRQRVAQAQANVAHAELKTMQTERVR